ncbi:hypothetical protein [Brevundimonas lenta]|uniref:Uncharacterized protein n=1 Tax=Brevundimonas lenta TaxID=424796 RepID=A0A7W6JAH2_9CAUL|nr:hypothetical protein [Brevundimonas lenta]MBB4081519.1 hypothetical protein [Brevundimonas lenta]
MKRGVRSALIAAGVLGAALVPLSGLGLLWLPFQVAHTAILERLPTPILARVLIGKAGDTIVADSRGRWPIRNGLVLYGQPGLTAPGICALEIYSVGTQYVTRARGRPGDRPLTATTVYGALSAPGEDCSSYRDFEHLFGAEDYIIEDAIQVLSNARKSAGAGPLTFSARCLSRLESQEGRPCDARSYLASLDFKKLNHIRLLGDDADETRSRYRVTFMDGDVHGHPLLTTLKIETRHRSRYGPEIVAVDIKREAL